MRISVRVVAFAFTAAGMVACSGGGTSSTSNLADGGSVSVDGATQPGPTTGGAANPNTPASGCRDGFLACSTPARAPAVCAHVQDDYVHCGSCDKSCSGGSCVNGVCDEASQACPFGAMCGSTCIKDRLQNVDHCGSCFNRCADADLCVGGTCVTPEGAGTSCASPLTWDVEAEEQAGFRLSFSPQTTFVHPCGPLSPIPTKWFRFTGPKSSTNVSVRSSVPSDKLVISVFSSTACNEAVLVGCSADKSEPTVDVPNAAGKTFFVAVGSVGSTADASASIRVDH